MRLRWHAKWRNPDAKGVRSGLASQSSTLTPRGDAISMFIGFDRLRLLRVAKGERLEFEGHFLRLRA